MPMITRKSYSPSLIALSVLLGICYVSAQLFAPPTPSLVPELGTWQFDIQLYGDPQRIEITLPGSTESKTYWYLLYTITNNTGKERDFYPQFELFTDTLRLYQAGVKVRRPVFEAIRARYNNTIPLLEPESMVTGRILVGEDNARDCVAIFEDFDPAANSVKIFISGLSNETVKVKSPLADSDNAREFLLRKTLMMQYQVPGDALSPEKRVMLYRTRDWIMR
jgi:hypothetical protein